MRFAIILPLLAAFAILEVFIGGARLLYAVPGVSMVALAALLSARPSCKTSPRADLSALLAACGFAFYILVRNRFSEVEYIARLQFFITAGCLLAYLLVALVLTESGDRRILFYFLIFLALMQLVPGLIQFSEGSHWMPLSWAQRRDESWRGSGFFISPNNFAGYMEVVTLVASGFDLWGRSGKFLRIFMGYTVLAGIAGVAISGSRGGYLSLTTGFLVMALLSLLAWHRLHRRRFVVAATVSATALLLLGGAVWAALQSPILLERALQINDPQNMRLLLWHAALQQFNLSPVWGTGGFSYLYFGRLFRDPLVQNDPIHVHNDYLQLLADYGIVGAALLLVLVVLHLRAGFSSYRQLVNRAAHSESPLSDRLALTIGCLSAVAAYLVHSVVDFNMQLPLNALMMATVLAVLANPGSRREEESSPTVGIRIRLFLRWMLPVGGIALLAYGLPMIPGELAAERSRVALRDGHAAESLEIARAGIKRTKDSPELYFNAGEAAFRLAQVEGKNSVSLRQEAIADFVAGLKLFPYDSRLALKLAMAQAAAGNYFPALEATMYAKKIDPNSSFVPAYRGMVEYAFYYYDDAESAFRDAILLGGEGSDIARKGMELIAVARKASNTEISESQPKSPEPGEAENPSRPERDTSQSTGDLMNTPLGR